MSVNFQNRTFFQILFVDNRNKLYLCIAKLTWQCRLRKNMSNNIKHSGVVESIGNDCMKVRIMQTSACSGCKIAAHCSASETKEKLIDIYDSSLMTQYKTGDSVVVVASYKNAMQAVILGFVFPFVILLAVLLITLQLTGNEPFAALLSIGMLIPYYFVIYMIRERLRQKFSFTVERES